MSQPCHMNSGSTKNSLTGKTDIPARMQDVHLVTSLDSASNASVVSENSSVAGSKSSSGDRSQPKRGRALLSNSNAYSSVIRAVRGDECEAHAIKRTTLSTTSSLRKEDSIISRRATVRSASEMSCGDVTRPSKPLHHKMEESSIVQTNSCFGTNKVRRVSGVSQTKGLAASQTIGSSPSPQAFLNTLLQQRGYSTKVYQSLQSGYHTKPTAHQKASYGIVLVRAVRSGDAAKLSKLLSCGLSRNPCNDFGESLLHMVCRRGQDKLLDVMVEAGCSLQVSDDFGRTPLHDACWTAEPCFNSIDTILCRDRRLLNVADCRGSTPLAYVKKDHWKKWLCFLDENKDRFWPPRNVAVDGEEPPPPLMNMAPNSQIISEPANAASLSLASLIASGSLDVDKAMMIPPEKRSDFRTESQTSLSCTGLDSNKTSTRKIGVGGNNGGGGVVVGGGIFQSPVGVVLPT